MPKLLRIAKPKAEELYSADWSPDGKLLVTAGRESPVTLWDAENLTPLRELPSPEWVSTAKFNPAGTRLMFFGGTPHVSEERYLEIWSVP